jgi:hypothetical protein
MMSLRQAPAWIYRFLLCVTLGFGLFGTASAGIVGTADAVDSAQMTAKREQLKTLVQRPELAKELQELGATPSEALARVDAMSDAEVVTLTGKLGDLPAGGRLSNNELTLILILVIVLLIAL